MKLHIFNPEHDIALAANLTNFTAPHAGRQLRHDLGFLPALWAEPGDVVLVDDVAEARKGIERLRRAVCSAQTPGLLRSNSCFQPFKLPMLSVIADGVDPWGWDLALRTALHRNGIDNKILPTKKQIAAIRQLSHRRVAAQVLQQLRSELASDQSLDKGCEGLLVGEAYECHTAEEVEPLMARFGRVVMKAPWSSSGRGIRFVDSQRIPPTISGWLRHLFEAQGSVMVEPYYNNVKDFGMEFTCLHDGSVRFDGLSLFKTVNGAYAGNVIATETAKQRMLSRYVPIGLLLQIQAKMIELLQSVLQDGYSGPLGVDMIIVSRPDANGFLLHPCVEVNLRRTMGHVALSLHRLCNPKGDDEVQRVMLIDYTDNRYKLRIRKL